MVITREEQAIILELIKYSTISGQALDKMYGFKKKVERASIEDTKSNDLGFLKNSGIVAETGGGSAEV